MYRDFQRKTEKKILNLYLISCKLIHVNFPEMKYFFILFLLFFLFPDHLNNWVNLDIKSWPLVLRHTSHASNMIDCLLSSIIPPMPVGFLKTLTFAGSDLYPIPSCNCCQRCFCCPFSVMQREFIQLNLCYWASKIAELHFLRPSLWHWWRY